MKKVLVAALAVAMVACLAQAQEVKSVNVVGFNKIAIGAQQSALVVLPFESFGDSTITDLVGNQLPSGSRANIWDRQTKTYVKLLKSRAGWDGTNVIMRGDAFWLYNAGEATTVTFMGEVPYDYNNAATTTVYNITGYDGMGYAYPTDMVWTNSELAKLTVSGDRLNVWNIETQSYEKYLKSRAGWDTPPGYKIPAGRGFFVYTSQTIDWTEVAPYNLND